MERVKKMTVLEFHSKFNSQICTTREQSERLLALGLKKETADMGWVKLIDGDGYVMAIAEDYSFIDIPAWSLHRLIELIPEFFANTKLEFRIEAIKWAMKQEGSLYDNLIILIADSIKNGGILNKEYLV